MNPPKAACCEGATDDQWVLRGFHLLVHGGGGKVGKITFIVFQRLLTPTPPLPWQAKMSYPLLSFIQFTSYLIPI